MQLPLIPIYAGKNNHSNYVELECFLDVVSCLNNSKLYSPRKSDYFDLINLVN